MSKTPFPRRPYWPLVVAGVLTGVLANVPTALHHLRWPWSTAIVLSVFVYLLVWGGVGLYMRRWDRRHSLHRFTDAARQKSRSDPSR